ncbi:EVE domain-containing protein [uncultured Methanobrevibacter sp.]|uniref:EVE domain-containing protein n=1 Tax=uncultured Methanobrevibacter sp. TaxID=253161 RepID=UPI0026291A2D|nr:EVE domain-containing protein [uncultured Methanobrevibacter sp.]
MDNSNVHQTKDLSIRLFSELNLDDSFFDSLKDSYPEFEKWFKKKSANNESAYVFMDEDGHVLDFLYLKNEEEEIKDVSPVLPSKKRLKVGTFKILPRHSRRGERFMKKIMDRAIADDVDEVYVTIFPKIELEYLIKSFENYGFQHIADKDHGERGSEYVLVKNMREVYGDIVKDYPFVKSEGVKKHILSIRPDYHTMLFPDSILHNENPYDLVKDISPTNSIHKIYICWMDNVDQLKKGDLLLIYRTSDGLGPANYRSVVTSICTVNEVRTYNDFKNEDEFIKYTNQYSIFSENDLRKWYRYKNNFTVIKMLYNVAFTNKVIRKRLLEEVGMDGDMYWGFCPVSDEQYKHILKLGGADERYLID